MATHDPATYSWSKPVIIALFIIVTIAQGMYVLPLPFPFLLLSPPNPQLTNKPAQYGRRHGTKIALQGRQDGHLRRAPPLPSVAQLGTQEPCDVQDGEGRVVVGWVLEVLEEAECDSSFSLSLPPASLSPSLRCVLTTPPTRLPSRLHLRLGPRPHLGPLIRYKLVPPVLVPALSWYDAPASQREGRREMREEVWEGLGRV